MIVPPIIVNDCGDVMFFSSINSAEQYIEPWNLDDLESYDSEGKVLKIVQNGHRVSFTVEVNKEKISELKELLKKFFSTVAEILNLSEDWICEASLEDLVQKGIELYETR